MANEFTFPELQTSLIGQRVAQWQSLTNPLTSVNERFSAPKARWCPDQNARTGIISQQRFQNLWKLGSYHRCHDAPTAVHRLSISFYGKKGST